MDMASLPLLHTQCFEECLAQVRWLIYSKARGWVWRLIPEIPALWEVDSGRSLEVRTFETSLANMHPGMLFPGGLRTLCYDPGSGLCALIPLEEIRSVMLEGSDVIIVHCSLELLDSSSPPSSASQSTGITVMSHHLPTPPEI
ncbi:hypothetical protein AAY473_033552 [Plecturocebus cupreus]